MRTEDIRIRDPYIVVRDGVYYMYKSDYTSDNKNIYVLKSRDLKEWGEPKVVYTLSEDSWGCADLWAPEVHLYNGKYYMFLSLLGKNGLRGTEISVCDTPDGTFIPLTNRPATPDDRSCIDGSLFVENGVPYMTYSADWPFNFVEEKGCYVGAIWAVELTTDLKDRVGEPFCLFASDEAMDTPDSFEYEGRMITRYGSDAPFVQRLKDGRLLVTWSPMPNGNYVVLGATSDSMRGKWEHLKKPIFDRNGGHAMFFDGVDGKRYMCIHCPEKPPMERASFIEFKGDGIL